VYTGYIESFMFPDGSDTIVFTLTFNDDGTVTGTVRFGTAPLLKRLSGTWNGEAAM
jgi:hypothetical protein